MAAKGKSRGSEIVTKFNSFAEPEFRAQLRDSSSKTR
jgi:hypothetical protein